jgi:hypothetical protein
MDPGSDVHICNKAGSNWRQTSLLLKILYKLAVTCIKYRHGER